MALREEIEAALIASPIGDVDWGTAELAIAYAAAIDGRHQPCEECGCQGGGDLGRLGPALLAALEALLLSPRARAAAKKAVTSEQPAANQLDQLAAARARKGRAETVDATAP